MSVRPEPLEVAFRGLVGVDSDHVDLRRRAGAVLARKLGFDFAVWATIDPTTLMWTHCVFSGGERDPALEADVFRNEYLEDDVLKLADLVHTPGHVGSLSSVTADDPQASRRFREALAPRGFKDELRLLCTDGNDAWGALCLLRAGGTFTSEEHEQLARVGTMFGTALRGALLRTAVTVPNALSSPPGFLFCDATGQITGASEEAESLLGEVDASGVPAAVASVLARRAAGQPATATVPTRAGGWLALHATSIGDRPAVVVERLRSHHLADLIVRLRGLTERERDIVGCIARGLSTKKIATELFISEWTVQDHLKAVFAKFAVNSRTELIAALFFDHYKPQHDQQVDPSPYGWFLRDGRAGAESPADDAAARPGPVTTGACSPRSWSGRGS